MAQDGAKRIKVWEELARKASSETDPKKLEEIIKALCQALDEPAQGVRPESAG